MSKIFREGMQVPQDPDGGSAKPTKPKKKTKPKKLVLPPLRKGEKEAPSDPDDGSIGMKAGGSPGMHRMPDGKMMKDSAHKKHGGKVKGYKSGGKVRGAGIAKRGLGKGRMC